MNRYLLEVIACSVEDARAAEAGGADRLELCSRLDLQGLTPSLEMTARIVSTVSIPARVMLRSNEGFTASEHEIEQMERKVAAMAALPIQGLICGWTDEAAKLDFKILDRVLRKAPASWHITIHRVFDFSAGTPEEKFEAIRRWGRADRILSGQPVSKLAAGSKIKFIVGGGVTRADLPRLVASSGCDEFHVGRAVREPEETTAPVVVEKVRAIRTLLDSL